jgi:NADP-dependent 3-hydroxy acid dehydrogenase YdfG
VSTVYPSATDTSIFDGVPGEWDRTRMHRPEDVAELVWRAYRAPAAADVADLELPPRAMAAK